MFPKAVLYQHGILRGMNKKGRTSMCLYPPSSESEEEGKKQRHRYGEYIRKVQDWQLPFYFDLSEGSLAESQRRFKTLIQSLKAEKCFRAEVNVDRVGYVESNSK